MSQAHRTAIAAIAVVLYGVMRRWFMNWGATDGEVASPLPGDELLVDPSLTTTRAITIDAPPEAVWPWLVQMGQDRAGLYSYDWLENLVGLDFHNADDLVPEWQQLDVGDQIRAAPASSGPDAGFTVVSLESGRWIVTVVGDPERVISAAATPPLPDGGTWVFVLEEVIGGRTRLLVRLRSRFGLPPPAGWLADRCLEPVHFVMERRQMLGIKERVERSAPSLHRRPE